MPKINMSSQEIADIASYLQKLNNSKLNKQFLAATEQEIKEGQTLYKDLGCASCHTSSKLSLIHVDFKYKMTELKKYLLNPQKDYPQSAMPHFKLSEGEARKLSAYLRTFNDEKGARLVKNIKGFSDRGKELFNKHNCHQCHQSPHNRSKSFRSMFSAHPNKGCVAEKPESHLPQYSLSKQQRLAVIEFLKGDTLSLQQINPTEFAKRQLKQLNCIQCHSLNGNASNWIGNTGTLALNPPEITNIGEKLLPHALEEILSGSFKNKMRPWMKGRMPSFKFHSKTLSQGLNERQGYPSKSYHNKDHAKLKNLMPVLKKYCNTCHSIDKLPALAAFGHSAGTNLKYSGSRLRHEYFMRWLKNPKRIDPTSSMPQFKEDKDIVHQDIFNFLRSLSPDVSDPPAHESFVAKIQEEETNVLKIMSFWIFLALALNAWIIASILRKRQ